MCFGQSDKKTIDLNLGFEQKSAVGHLPYDWVQWGAGYNVVIDTLEKNSGNHSVRIEPEYDKKANSVGFIVYPISSSLRAEEIEVRAHIKSNQLAGGSAGLTIRLDGPSGMVLGFKDMVANNIKGTKDWSVYSLKAQFPENVRTIYIGVRMSGNGQLWVDDFQVLLDGQDITEVNPLSPDGFKADLDTVFNSSSKIGPISLTPSKTIDLDVLGKVWGFLKYYHPSIAAGNYNWDAELFRILPRILNTKDQSERNSILNSWISGLGNFETSSNNAKLEKMVKVYPDTSWINSSTLGNELANSLNEIRSAKRSNIHYYITDKTDRFINENAYNTMRFPDVGFQLLALYRYWNIIQYYFPYKYLINEDWNKVLAEFIPAFVNARTDLEYKISLLELIARIHDTHANIYVNETLDKHKGQRYTPLQVTFVENKALVTNYVDKTLGTESGLEIGDVIEFVDGKAIEEIVKEKLLLTPASNYPTQLREIANDLLRTNNSTLDIKYTRGKKKASAQIKTYSNRTINIYSPVHKSDTCFKLLSPEISYIYPGLIKNKYLPGIMKEVQKTKGLIIDFRCYPLEVVLPTLGPYLVPHAKIFVKFSSPSITTPGLFTMNEPKTFGQDNSNYYKGKVVIIINETTQSQAEFTTMAFRKAPQAVVIGSTTAGADGDVARFLLPGAVFTMISGLGIYYPDGTETQRVGIIPDIEVKPTIKGIREGRDELLEKAIQLIR